MPAPQLLSAQRDFSAGEIDPDMKRRDDLPIHKAAGRQMRDFRTLNTGIAEQRPGRRARYLNATRVDQVSVSPTLTYDLCFDGDGSFIIRDAAGTQVALQTGYPWTYTTIDLIVWTKVKTGAIQTDIIITFPGLKTVVASFDGVATWTIGNFSFAIDGTGAALVPFFRVAAPGATMTPSATLAAGIAGTALWSAPVLNALHVGTLFRFAGRRVRIDAPFIDSTHANITAIDALLRTQQLTLVAPDGSAVIGTEGFSLGQIVQGSTSGAQGEVVGINLGANTIAVQLTNFASGFLASAAGPPIITELVIGPNGRSKVTAVGVLAPLGAVSWDEQIISDARGWPQSCNTDDSRLILCDLPGTPEAILWSATGQPYNFTVGANATDAMLEIMAGKPRIYHVCPATDEIVFTNQGVFYIPINQTNPLRPGSVRFQPITPEASSTAKPAFTSGGYLYVNAGRNRINIIVGTGTSLSTQPYKVTDVTQFHTHLFAAGPKAIAVATGDGQFPEQYAYVCNADGSVVMGKFDPGKEWVGWLPWGGLGSVRWVSSLFSNVSFVSVYPVPGVAAGVSVCEMLDENYYLDGAIAFNQVPTAMAPPIGQGGFWWAKGTTVELMDGIKPLGPHLVDGSGFVTQAYQGENLEIGTLIAGFAYTPTFEPFIPGGQPGQDMKQRSLKRSIARAVVSVKNSTGFMFATLYSGKYGPLLPVAGSVQKFRRVAPWNDSEDQSLAPVPREETYTFRPKGRSYDPRAAIIKDTPGPIQLIEVAIEASV